MKSNSKHKETMQRLIVAVIVAIGCGACTPTATRDESPAVLEVAFACVNGESLTVRFFTMESRAVLMRNESAIELPQQPSGSGFIYSNGPNTIRGKGNDLTVEIGRMVPIQCTAR